MDPNQKPSKPTLCPDGKYRWIYEVNMYTNPIIFLTVIKAILVSAVIIIIIGLVIILFQGDLPYIGPFDWEENKYGIMAIGAFILVVIISYCIVARSYGGKYIVLFEMDDTCVTHTQMEKQFEKAKAIGWLTAAVGAATGNLSMAGLGLSSSARNNMTSYWKDVKRVIPKRHFNTIKVNNLLLHNQVYVDDEDFDFVLGYIRDHVRRKKQ